MPKQKLLRAGLVPDSVLLQAQALPLVRSVPYLVPVLESAASLANRFQNSKRQISGNYSQEAT
ncbi:hypothetical protein HYS85_01810 [Candidatus Saccharibacteria bacterium]|nr:hypothetical protein [Candidatus Saccharibacteria bacterium]